MNNFILHYIPKKDIIYNISHTFLVFSADMKLILNTTVLSYLYHIIYRMPSKG